MDPWLRPFSRPLSRRSASPQKDSRPVSPRDSRPASPNDSKQTSPQKEPRTVNGLLSPEIASISRSNSDGSRRSSTSGRRGSIFDVVKNRLRSPSNASVVSNKSQLTDVADIENWFHGFRKYNHLVSTSISPKQAAAPKEFEKASKALTKNCGGQFLHGLPESVFDLALLWCPADRLERLNADEPSWSWSGYSGPVNFPFDPTSCPDTYKIPRDKGALFRSEIRNFTIGPPGQNYTVRRDMKNNPVRIDYPSPFDPPHGKVPSTQSNTLRFCASTISAEGFDVQQIEHDSKEIPCSQLINDKNQACGVVMEYESCLLNTSHEGEWEYVLLSRNLWREPSPDNRKPNLSTMHPSGTPIWDGERFLWDAHVNECDEEHFAVGDWKMLNVMLIKWVNNGTHAERVAIARIHEDAWIERCPKQKNIVLQ
ncbi:heterokaryon incompatibility [Pyrenophora seminiperda CCB06]|uniref:Heterokaryon incompatibility n=1 Tax=Pyrenophora seminiperda CCB06 TaxID=1302712 RepID=A0A3M7MHA8_9PLEO|nr:heterokaryon incompatibility [Pyrenophora seminiperda CCB06]